MRRTRKASPRAGSARPRMVSISASTVPGWRATCRWPSGLSEKLTRNRRYIAAFCEVNTAIVSVAAYSPRAGGTAAAHRLAQDILRRALLDEESPASSASRGRKTPTGTPGAAPPRPARGRSPDECAKLRARSALRYPPCYIAAPHGRVALCWPGCSESHKGGNGTDADGDKTDRPANVLSAIKLLMSPSAETINSSWIWV